MTNNDHDAASQTLLDASQALPPTSRSDSTPPNPGAAGGEPSRQDSTDQKSRQAEEEQTPEEHAAQATAAELRTPEGYGSEFPAAEDSRTEETSSPGQISKQGAQSLSFIVGDGLKVDGDLSISLNPGNEQVEESPTDLTQSFDFATQAFPLSAEALDASQHVLEDYRFVVIQCDDRQVALYATLQLMQSIGIPSDEAHRRLLSMRGNIALDNITNRRGDLTLDTFLTRQESLPAGSAVVVNLFRGLSEMFLMPLARAPGALQQVEEIRECLGKRGLFLICVVPPYIVEKVKIAAAVPSWSLDATKVRLLHQFPHAHADLYNRLQRQKATGVWGTEDFFYDNFIMALNNGSFLKLLEEYENSEASPKASFTGLLQTSDAQRDVLCATLFTGVFFPGISLKDFEEVLEVFLEHRTVQETQSESYQDEAGMTKTRLVRQDIPLKQIWQEKRREIFRECKLTTTVSEEDGQRFIVFQLPHLREEARRLLNEEDPFYTIDRFEDICKAGLLFCDSTKILRNVTDLSLSVAVENPDNYGRNWLVGLVRGAERHFRRAGEQAQRATTVLLHANELLAEVVGLIEQLSDEQKQPFYSRMAYLLREMQSHPQLENIAEEFLRDLFGHGEHEAVCMFVEKLQDVPGFRTLHWLKRLLAEGKEGIRKKANHLLFRYTNKNVWRHPEILDEICQWVPNTSEQDHLPSFYGDVLGIFNELCFRGIYAIPLAQYGFGQTVAPVISHEDGELHTLPSLEAVVQALCHPDQGKCWVKTAADAAGKLMTTRWFALSDTETFMAEKEAGEALKDMLGVVSEQSREQDIFDVFLAFVVGEWVAILCGLHESAQVSPGVLRARDAILQTVARNMPSRRRERLMAVWRRQQQLLREKSDSLRKQNRAVARVVGVRRGVIAHMSDQFYKFHKSCEQVGQ